MSSKVRESAGKVLVVENDADFADSLEMILDGEGYDLTVCEDGIEALEMSRRADFDAVITDYRLPGMGGLELLDRMREDRPRRPVILMTAHGNANLAIEATRKGAFDYLLKPFDLDELTTAIERAVRAGQSMGQKVHLGGDGADPSSSASDTVMIGNSRAMQKVYKEIGRVAPTDAPVLVLGATGTGKELAARALFQYSSRADQPFVAVNCGAIAENLLESELFGHEKGAFTGAVSARIGRFEQADGGTLFLDEIGDMPLEVQVKMLRVLQEGTVQPVGGRGEREVDVRVIAATHRSLEKLIREKKFREDLYYRLGAMRIELPDLSERTDDIPLLAKAIVARAAADYGVARPKLPKAVLRQLEAYSWPGNIRQLQNVLRHAVLHSGGYDLSEEAIVTALAGEAELASAAADGDPNDTSSMLDQWVSAAVQRARDMGSGHAHAELVAELEQRLIRAALHLSGGHLGKVSDWLGISRVTLRKKMADYQIGTGEDRATERLRKSKDS